jgi:hypothetical protein
MDFVPVFRVGDRVSVIVDRETITESPIPESRLNPL